MNPEKTEPQGQKSRWWIWLVVLCAAGGAAYLFLPRFSETSAAAAKEKKGGKGDPNRAVPVVAALSHKGDMPVFLNGLGSVTAFYTVTVRTRVDGEIMKVSFEEGQTIKKGDVLVDIDPRPFQVQLEQAEGQMAKDQALLDNANVDLERYKVLFGQEAVPKQTLDTQVATVHQYDATIKSDKAAVDSAKLNLIYAHITSPITGRIGLRLVDPGNVVHATDANGLAVITQLQPIAVIFNIAEDSLPLVTKKMAAGQTLPVLAYDRDLKMKLGEGILLTIDNQIDQTTGTVKFKGVFENKDLSLFPNQFVNARLLLDTKHGAVIVPTAAIQRSPQSTFVYVVKDDNTVEVRDITVGITEGDEASVEKGLGPGEKVVIDGIDKLQQGTRVNVRMVGAAARQT